MTWLKGFLYSSFIGFRLFGSFNELIPCQHRVELRSKDNETRIILKTFITQLRKNKSYLPLLVCPSFIHSSLTDFSFNLSPHSSFLWHCKWASNWVVYLHLFLSLLTPLSHLPRRLPSLFVFVLLTKTNTVWIKAQLTVSIQLLTCLPPFVPPSLPPSLQLSWGFIIKDSWPSLGSFSKSFC